MTTIRLKLKYRTNRPIAQFGAGPNQSGNGAKPALYRKKHERADQPDGTGPRGTCIRQTTRKDAKLCRCGGCSGRGTN
jgi:hypothetical protein